MKFSSHYTSLSAHQAEILSQLEDLLYTKEGSEETTMHALVARYGFEACSLSEDENCMLDAVVDQLNRLRKVTDSEELRQQAVAYLEGCPLLADGTPLQTFVKDEEWAKYLKEMRENHYCDHLMLLALASVLRRSLVVYSGAEPGLEPIRIIPDNEEPRFRPVHLGHVSRLTFVTLRPKNPGVQEQDDDDVDDDEDVIIHEDDEDEESDMTDEERPDADHFHRRPAGESSQWNVRIQRCYFSNVNLTVMHKSIIKSFRWSSAWCPPVNVGRRPFVCPMP